MPGLSLLLPFVEGLVGPKFAKPLIYGVLGLLILLALWGGKCAYDSTVIKNYTNGQTAVTAKADLKANDHAAEQRRADDSRLQTETAEVNHAVEKAGTDPAARRNAYYACVVRQQSARRAGKPSPAC